MDIWPKSRQINRYMIKLAKICIFSKYMGFLQDLYSTGAKVLDPNNISLYQPDDIMLLGAVPTIMGDKDFHLLC